MGFGYLQVIEAYSIFGDDVDSMVCYLLETGDSSRRKGKATEWSMKSSSRQQQLITLGHWWKKVGLSLSPSICIPTSFVSRRKWWCQRRGHVGEQIWILLWYDIIIKQTRPFNLYSITSSLLFPLPYQKMYGPSYVFGIIFLQENQENRQKNIYLVLNVYSLKESLVESFLTLLCIIYKL